MPRSTSRSCMLICISVSQEQVLIRKDGDDEPSHRIPSLDSSLITRPMACSLTCRPSKLNRAIWVDVSGNLRAEENSTGWTQIGRLDH